MKRARQMVLRPEAKLRAQLQRVTRQLRKWSQQPIVAGGCRR